MTRDEVVLHCKEHAEMIRKDDMDKLVSDQMYASSTSDMVYYPLQIQTWITLEAEPILSAIREYAMGVDSDNSDKEAWEKILQLTDLLKESPSSKY